MTSALFSSTGTGALAGMTRVEYVNHKLGADTRSVAFLFLACWVAGFDTRSLAGLAVVDLLILALSRLDHGRKWDRAHLTDPQLPPAGQHSGT
jgi:hypothetical protein